MPDSLWTPAAAPGQFASDDLDEVREHMDAHNGTHWRHALRGGPVGFRLAVVAGERMKFAWCGVKSPHAIRGSVDAITAHVTLAGRSSYRLGRREISVGAGDLVFLPAGQDVTIETQSLRRLALRVPDEAMYGESLAGVARRTLPPDAIASLRRVLAGLVRASRLPPATRQAAVSHAEARFADWALERFPGAGDRRSPRLAPERVRRIEEWIDAHLHDPISLPQLCELAGVRARCLQVAFASYRGQSPMEFVAERRLVAAHAAMARGEHASVIEAASAFGFEHPGRFAASYRRLFGLAPSEFLRQGRDRR